MGDNNIRNTNHIKYYSDDSNIADSQSDVLLDFGDVDVCGFFQIINSNSSGDMYVKLNETTNPAIIVKAGQSFSEERYTIKRVYISNSSGNTVYYQYIATGK